MTLPHERYNAVQRTRQFLIELCDPKKSPRIPKRIRREAYYCLRHFPSNFDLDRMATKCPEVMETENQLDKLTMMILDYEETKDV